MQHLSAECAKHYINYQPVRDYTQLNFLCTLIIIIMCVYVDSF